RRAPRAVAGGAPAGRGLPAPRGGGGAPRGPPPPPRGGFTVTAELPTEALELLTSVAATEPRGC
ncbi:hypothetical protein ACFV23_31010, partial [Streptomyces sp. NPDC059627]